MDIKDLIKWLFQIRAPNISKRTAPTQSKSVTKMSAILVIAATIYSCVNICEANSNVFDVSTRQSDNFKDKIQNKLSEGEIIPFKTNNMHVLNDSEANETKKIFPNVKNSKIEKEIIRKSNSTETKETNKNSVLNDKNATQLLLLTYPESIDMINASKHINNVSDGNESKNQLTFGGPSQFKMSSITSSIFRMIDGSVAYLDNLLDDKTGSETARTFGRPLRKLQAALLPIMFKLGVIATLIFMTFLLSLKAVAIGLLLLLFKVAGVIATFKAGLGHHGGHGGFSHDEWSPHKEVHVHIHNSGHGHESAYYPTYHHSSHSASAYDPWSRQDVSAAALPLPVPIRPHPVPLPIVPSYPPPIAGPGSIDTPYGHYIRTGGPTAPQYLK